MSAVALFRKAWAIGTAARPVVARILDLIASSKDQRAAALEIEAHLLAVDGALRKMGKL